MTMRLATSRQQLIQDDDEDEVMLNLVASQFDVSSDALWRIVHRKFRPKRAVYVILIGRDSKDMIGFLLTTLRIPLYFVPIYSNDNLECNVRYS